MSTVAPPSFPFPVIDPLDPPEGCEDLQASTPVSRVSLPGGHPAWLVTRLADVRAVLADGRFSREAITAPDAPRVLPIAAGSKSIFVMDAPEHTRLRRLVAQAFSVRRMDALRPRVKELTGRLIDTMVAGGAPGDLMVHLAQPLPITVICELLGVPYTDVDRFRAWTDLMLSFGTRSQAEVIAARAARLVADGTRPSQIAVLYRTNVQGEAFEEALAAAGVGYQVRGGERFFARRDVRDAVVLLRGAVRSADPGTPMPEHARDVLSSVGWAPQPPAPRGAARLRPNS